LDFSDRFQSLDRADLSILRMLQEDGRQSFAVLGKRIGLSATTVSERVHRLESINVIEAYRAQISAPKLGFPVTAFVDSPARLSLRFHNAFERYQRHNSARSQDRIAASWSAVMSADTAHRRKSVGGARSRLPHGHRRDCRCALAAGRPEVAMAGLRPSRSQ